MKVAIIGPLPMPLLNHDLTLDDIYEHDADEQIASLSTDELARADRDFYASHRVANRSRIVGFDASAPVMLLRPSTASAS